MLTPSSSATESRISKNLPNRKGVWGIKDRLRTLTPVAEAQRQRSRITELHE